MLCSSSLAAISSSLVACSSSFAVSCSWIGRLQVLLGVGELVFERASADRATARRRRSGPRGSEPRHRQDVGKRRDEAAGVAGCRRRASEIEHVRERAVRVAQRLGDQRDSATAVARHRHAPDSGRSRDRGARDAARRRHGVRRSSSSISSRFCDGRRALILQQRLDAAERIDQLPVLVDQKARRHEAIEQPVVDRQQLRVDPGVRGAAGGTDARQRAAARQRQLQVARQADVAPLPVDLGVLVDRVELVEQAAGALARAEKQEPAGLQREVEQRQHRLLRVRLEVDQQVAARDQVHLRER